MKFWPVAADAKLVLVLEKTTAEIDSGLNGDGIKLGNSCGIPKNGVLVTKTLK